jgi:hypothetical protein
VTGLIARDTDKGIVEKFNGASRKLVVVAPYIVLFLLACYPFVLLAWSMAHGRLAFDTGYDDVSYAADSARRFQLLRDSGLSSYFTDLVTRPPHSVMSTLIGSLGFPVFGLSNYAFYVGNAVLFWVVSAAGFVTMRTFTASRLGGYIFVIFLMASPIGFRLVQDSRPDIASGLFLGIACIAIWNFAVCKKKGLILGSVMVALAVTSKMSFIPHNVLILGLAVVFILIFGASTENSRIMLLKSLLLLISLSLVIALPALLLGWNDILAYITENALSSQQSLWTFSKSNGFLGLLLIYLGPGWQSLGGFVTQFAIVVGLIGLVVPSLRRFRRRIIFLATLGIASFITVVWLAFHNEYFFATSHAFGLLILVLSSTVLLESANKHVVFRIIAFTSFAVMFLFACANVTQSSVVLRYPEARIGSSENARIVSETTKGGAVGDLYLTTTGPVNPDSIAWIAAQDGVQLTSSSGAFLKTAREITDEALLHSTVIVPSLFSAEYNRSWPSGLAQTEVIKSLFEAGYRPYGESSGTAGYARILSLDGHSNIPVQSSVDGFETALISKNKGEAPSRLLAPGKTGEVCFMVDSPGKFKLNIAFLSPIPTDISFSWRNSHQPRFAATYLPASPARGEWQVLANLPPGENCLEIQPQDPLSGITFDADPIYAALIPAKE